MNSKQASIAALAYELWHRRGCPHDSPEVDWHAAEQQLSALEASIDGSEIASFPASDPPASHGADNPPSNAGAKWKVARTA
jgi:hypothetical protein